MKEKIFLIYGHDEAQMVLIMLVSSCWSCQLCRLVLSSGVWFSPSAAVGKRLASKRMLNGIAHNCNDDP